MSCPSNIVNALLWCIILASQPVVAQHDVRSQYSVRFDTVSMSSLRPAWSGPLLLSSDPRSGKQLLGRFGNQSVSVSLQDLPAHTMVKVEFEIAVIGSWDGEQDKDRLRVVVDGRDTLLNATFSNTAYRQSYPDPAGTAAHRQRTGAHSQNTLGFKFVEKDVYNGSLDATYGMTVFVSHTSDSMRIQFEGILSDMRPGIENESWALQSVDVQCIETTAKALFKIPRADTTFSDDVFPGIVPTSIAVHDLRLPIVVVECLSCRSGCDAVSIAVYTNGTAAAWKQQTHFGVPAATFDLTLDELRGVENAVTQCLRDDAIRKHLAAVVERAGSRLPNDRDCTLSFGLGEDYFTCLIQKQNPPSLESLRSHLRKIFEQHGWTGGP
ncbi:hypothetical protein BH10BAC6_BH10BAC6_18390 [soil metagenome]